MAKQLKKIAVILLLFVMASGCSFGKKEKSEPDVTPGEYVVTASDDGSICKLITDYYVKLFAIQPDSYTSYSASGTVPNEIKAFISGRTMKEGKGNPEIGLHYPRFVSINGCTTVNYQITKEKGKPSVKPEFIGMDGSGYLYYVKIDLMASCFPDSTFSSLYKEDATSRTYTKVSLQNSKPAQMIRLEARYDVEIIKEEGQFKILKATESSNPYGYKNRLFRLNNDFISRLSYLNLDKDSSGLYVDEKDGKQYESEKSTIQDFFNRLVQIDSDRMKLLTTEWNKGKNEFQAFLDQVGAVKSKDGKVRMLIGEDYKQKFDINSFPLKPVMQKIVRFKNFSITPHPSYSNLNRKYVVKMDADVQQMNGISDRTCTYRYDYFVILCGNGNDLKVCSIKLNGYFI